MSTGYPLIVLSQPPYAGTGARAALDLALAFAVFNQSPRVLFDGEGVLQLVHGQTPDALGRKSLARVIDSFPLYDLDQVFVADSALGHFGLSPAQLAGQARVLDASAVRQLRSDARHILSL